MMNAEVSHKICDKDFSEYERNRMYPLGYGKELPMKDLDLKHAEALSAAKLHLIRVADKGEPVRFKAILEEHIKCLSEVYWWVLHTIYTHGDPKPLIPEPSDKPKPEKSTDHGTTTKPD